MNAKEIIEAISEEQVLEILADYGLTPVKEKENEFWFRTLCHGGDSNKLCMFRDSKDFFCYTNCGKMSLFSLLMKLGNCSFSETIRRVEQKVTRTGFGQNMGSYKKVSADIRYLERKQGLMSSTIKKHVQLPDFDPSVLDYFEHSTFYQGWYDEGISIKSMEKYGIAWYEYEKYIIIPHQDAEGRLVGIRRRSLKPEDAHNKYMPIIFNGVEYGHALGLNLYGLYQNADAIRRSKTACIVESEKSVMLGDTYFNDNNFAVATCGFNVSDAQISLIADLGVENIVLGFDKDFDEAECLKLPPEDPKRQGYERHCKRLYSICNKLVTQFNVYVLWDREGLLSAKDSPYDRGLATFESLWKNKVAIDGSLCLDVG